MTSTKDTHAVISRMCDGKHHRTGTEGHDGGPARYVITARCPAGCGWSQVAYMCAGRVHAIQASNVDMGCPACPHFAHWSEFWKVKPISGAGRPRSAAPQPQLAPSPPAALVDAFAAHLDSRGRAAGTVRQRVGHIRRLEQAHADLAQVTPEQLDLWVRGQAAGKRPATVNSLIKSLRVFYGWADRFGVIRPNPATLLDIVPNLHRMGRTVSEEELDEALRGASPQLRAMLLLGIWLTIVGKGEKQRRVFVVDELRHALDAIAPAGGGYFFPGRFGDHLHPMSVNKIITRETGFNPHALRHAAGTAVYEATKDLRATQAFLGHASPNTTTIYVHVTDDTIRAAAEAGARDVRG